MCEVIQEVLGNLKKFHKFNFIIITVENLKYLFRNGTKLFPLEFSSITFEDLSVLVSKEKWNNAIIKFLISSGNYTWAWHLWFSFFKLLKQNKTEFLLLRDRDKQALFLGFFNSNLDFTIFKKNFPKFSFLTIEAFYIILFREDKYPFRSIFSEQFAAHKK